MKEEITFQKHEFEILKMRVQDQFSEFFCAWCFLKVYGGYILRSTYNRLELKGLHFHGRCLNEFKKVLDKKFPTQEEWKIPFEEDPDFFPPDQF